MTREYYFGENFLKLLWVIEKFRPSSTQIFSTISGTYPVRLFGSLESFFYFVHENEVNESQGIFVLNFDDIYHELNKFEKKLLNFAKSKDIIFLTSENKDRNFLSINFQKEKKIHWIKLHSDPTILHALVSKLNTPPDKNQASTNIINFKDIDFNLQTFQMTLHPDQVVDLSMKEAKILNMLITQPLKCFTRKEMREHIWGKTSVSDRTIDSHVSRLRQRLSGSEVSITSRYGHGYLLQ